MTVSQTSTGDQARRRLAYRCTGCGTTAARVLTPLRNGRGRIGFLCPTCETRYADSTVFQRIVHACILGDNTVPEVQTAFAQYGLAIPTTAAEMQAAGARLFGGH